MLIKTIFFSILFSLSLFAYVQDVEVLAKSVRKDGDIIKASGDVVLYSQKYLITADRANYNQKTGDLELFGNITILEGVDFSAKSGRVKLNLNSEKGYYSPLFFFDDLSNLWISCEDATSTPDKYITNKSVASSCSVEDPDWKIDFTSGEYNRKNRFVSIYNAVFYAGKVPLLYLPYFSFSTDKTRRSGFLKPRIAFTKDEGIYFMQPIYFAPDVDWDVEFDPQIRTDRGVGINSTLRYVDSKYSKLRVETGVFSEYERYRLENNLINKKHYGFELNYDRSKLFADLFEEKSEDGLYLDFKYLNDIDYLNTKSSEDKSYNKLVTSRLNYYLKKDLDYYGLYIKYYIDTAKVSNKDTLQELPTLQYHRFSNTLLWDNMLYSVDVKVKNYEREEGLNATQYELNIPLTFYFKFMDDYLNFSFSENIYTTYISYANEDTPNSYGEYFRNYHKFTLYTDLLKPYEDFYHTVYLGLDYVVPSKEDKNGYFADFIPVDTEQESVTLNLVEYFYNGAGDKKVSHTLKQQYFFSDTRYKYGDLENKITLFLDSDITFSNTLFYSHQYNRFSKIQNSFSYKAKNYKFNLLHTYENSVTSDKNFITFNADTDYFRNYDIFASLNYDIKNGFFKSWKIGWKHKKRCWDYSVVYTESTTPQLTSSGDSSINKKGIYILFNLYPIGSIDYQFTKESGAIE